MPNVKVRENEPFEFALRRFKRTCEKAGVLADTRKKEFYEKPTQERKRKAAAAVKRQVLRCAARRSRDLVPASRRQGAGHAVGIEPAALHHSATKPGHQLFVEQQHRRTRRAAEHDQADRVRANIDDRLTSDLSHAVVDRDSLGTAPVSPSAAPRPESDGLFMK